MKRLKYGVKIVGVPQVPSQQAEWCGKERHQAPFIQKVDNAIAIHWINPLDSAIGFVTTYPLDIVIYPADSAIHRLNNWDQICHPPRAKMSFV